LLDGAVASCGYFDPVVLGQLWREHASGRADHSATLWKLVMLDAFLRHMQQTASGGVKVDP
jgi:asparagine synthase (glutamine-hydrolysing)